MGSKSCYVGQTPDGSFVSYDETELRTKLVTFYKEQTPRDMSKLDALRRLRAMNFHELVYEYQRLVQYNMV